MHKEEVSLRGLRPPLGRQSSGPKFCRATLSCKLLATPPTSLERDSSAGPAMECLSPLFFMRKKHGVMKGPLPLGKVTALALQHSVLSSYLSDDAPGGLF